MRKVKIKGNSSDEKFKHVEKMITHLSENRSGKYIVCSMPPIPVSSYNETVGADGDLLKFMCPMKGSVKNVSFFCDTNKEKNVIIEWVVYKGKSEAIQELEVKTGKINSVKLKVDIVKGDMITIRLVSDVVLSNIWVSFSLFSDLKQMESIKLIEDHKDLSEI